MTHPVQTSPDRTMGMVDIHCHLLPGVDDGVQTREEASGILSAYEAAGFSHIVCTPHLHDPFVKTQVANIRESFSWFEQEAATHGITAYLGSELYIQSTMGKYIPFLDTFQLIETNTQVEPLFLLERIFDLHLAGMTVIFAHVERYSWFTLESETVRRMREMGVLFQVNISSINDKKVQSYIDHGYVDFIASDNHGSRRGVPDFSAWKGYADIQARSMQILGLDT